MHWRKNEETRLLDGDECDLRKRISGDEGKNRKIGPPGGGSLWKPVFYENTSAI